MLVPGDHHHLHFGFWWLGLVLLVFLVIGFVIRRKWRLAVARKEEIKRLLMLASEEAARAELEASAGYYRAGSGSGSVSASASVSVFASSSPPFQCAVCYSPTTTRCARCKSVRYCSGKCQIIHWRQGHKEECYPSSITHQIIGDGSNSSQNAVKQEQRGTYGNDFETDGGQSTKPIETFIEEPVFGNSPEVPCVKKDDDIKVELPADAKVTTSTSKSSTTSFSAGFSTSTTSSESFDDVSVAESIGSNDLEKLYERQNVDIAFDTVETAYSVNNVDHTGPPSAEFISLVNDVYSSNSSCKLNQIKSSGSGGETGHRSSSFSGLSVNDSKDGSVVEASTASHGFWGKTLESSWSRNDALNDTSQSNFTGAGDGDISDSRSFLHFSFNLSGSTIPPLQSQGSEAKVNVLDDTHLASLEINNPIDGAALSKKINTDTPKFEQSPPSNSERSNHMNNGATTDSHKLRPKEVRSRSSSASYSHPSCSAGGELTGTDASKVTSMPSLSTKRSNHVVNGTSSTSHLLKSREVGSLSSASVAHSSSSNGGHSVPSLRSGKVDGIQAIATNSSQIGSYSPNASNGLKSSVWKVVDQFKASKLSKHSLAVGSETLGRYSDKGLFSYELFVKLYIWNKVELRPCGLTNCGNSCYANVVLQCLAFTPPLTAYLLQGLHSKACVKKEWCFTCEFESLILKAKDGNSPLSPKGILSQLSNIGSHLGNGRQEDAHEFLRYAIDTMQSVCLKEAEVNASGSLEEETTLIGLTFGGYLRSKIRCMKCRVKSERHERMMDLTVEIEGDIGTLDEALRQFTRTEILDGENKYRCNRCKSYEKAKKKLTVLEAPNVLTIALKRFQSGKFGKLNKSIEFPEILNLAPYMSGTSDKSPIYRLYGVVVHLDIMNAAFSGHYVCYVKNNQNKWFKIDDSSVKTVELERVLKKGAYMLLYTRCSPRAPRSIRNSLSRDPKIKIASSKLGVPSTVPSVFQSYPSSIPLDGPANLESSYSRLPMETIFEADSSSDSFSLFSSCSDEGSCSTESTRDSTSIDDLSDCILGDSGRSWKSPWRNSADSDTSSSSSSSPLYSRHSPLVDQEHSREPTGSQTDYADLVVEGDGLWARLRSGGGGLEDSEGKGSTPFLHSDMTKHCRKLDSISSCRETDSERLGWVNPFDNVKFGVARRRSTRERTD